MLLTIEKSLRKIINTKTIVAVAVILTAGAGLSLVANHASAATSYSNGFEVDTSDWSAATRVSSPLTPSSGAYYAEVPNGAFTRWGGYENSFPSGGYTTEVDVYLDMSLATGGADKRFDFSSAINDPSGNHRRDFIFNLGTNPSVDNQWLASVSNNAPGNPAGSSNNIVTINNSGWYTLTANFQDNGSGVLAVTMSVSEAGGGVIGSWTLSNPADVIGSTVGGHR